MASFREVADEPSLEEEAFTFVTRKSKPRKQQNTPPLAQPQPTLIPQSNLPGWNNGRKPTKIKKNSQRAKMMGNRCLEAETRTIDWGLEMISDRKSTLLQSKFFVAFQELVQLTLFPPCQKQKEDSLKANTSTEEDGNGKTLSVDSPNSPKSDLDTPASKDFEEIRDIICYGVGSIESSRNSQFQLALILCLKDFLKTSGSISIFDPIMTDYDQRLAERLGIEVIKVNEQARQPILHRTLLYMPHCPKGLYSHVLETNWTREQLDKVLILGNRFTMYDENPSFKHYVKQAPFILPALSIAKVTPFPAVKFEDNTVFNDLAFHCFPSELPLPVVDLQGREQDPEML